MANSIFVTEEAQAEVMAALNYYKEISPELSEDLLLKYLKAVSQISAHPKIYPIVRGNYRKINLERFPYKLVFRIWGENLIIVALAHHKRKANYWRNH